MVVLLTIATGMTPNVANFEATARKHGWAPLILGMGKPWEGWVTKMKLFRDALATLDPDELVVCSDSGDVLVLDDPSSFERKYAKAFSGRSIVFSVENLRGMTEATKPDAIPLLRKRYPNTKKTRVCAGVYGGRAGALHALWVWALGKGYKDDQTAAAHYARLPEQEEHFDFDVESALFYNDSQGSLATFDSGTLTDPDMGGATVAPVFYHAPAMRKVFWKSSSNYELVSKAQLGPVAMTPERKDAVHILLVVSGCVVAALFVVIVALSVATHVYRRRSATTYIQRTKSRLP